MKAPGSSWKLSHVFLYFVHGTKVRVPDFKLSNAPLRDDACGWRKQYKVLFSDVSALFPAYALVRWAV